MRTLRQLFGKCNKRNWLGSYIFFIERRGLPNVTVETKDNSNVVKLVEGPDDVM